MFGNRVRAAIHGLCVVLSLATSACGDSGGAPGTTGTIEGTVSLAGASDHGGVLVVVNETGDVATSAPDGRFRLVGVAPGFATLTASREGYVSATSGQLTITAGRTTEASALELVPVRGVIIGTALKEGETDHSGIVVRLLGTMEEVVTGADGAFTFGSVAVGTHTVEALADGFDLARSAPLTVVGDAPVDAGTLVLPRSRGSLTGMATLEGETDHSGILVSLQGTAHATLTGPNGAYSFDGVRVGQYTVEATKNGFAQASVADQTVEAGQTTTVTALQLARNPGTVTGHVALEGGGDPTGTAVTLVGTGITAVADASGAFTLASVPTGTYVVQATHAGFDAAQSAPFTLAPGGAHDVGTLTLATSRGGLAGTATLEGETDHSGILVSLQGTSYATITGPTGAYAFSGIPVGQYTVVATKTSFAQASVADQTVEAGQTTTVTALQLARNPGTVTGHVALEGGGDPTGTAVTLVGTGITAVADASGAFTLASVPTGTYVVQATHAGFDAAQSAPFTLAPGGAHDVGTLTLATSRGGLTGTATLEGETDHSGILVSLQGTSYATITGPTGAYSFAGVAVGQYTVVATKTGFAQTSAADQAVLANQTTTVTAMVLARNPGTVTGHVALEGGGDPTGTAVTLVGTGITAVADASGAFTLASVPTGTYVVQATHAGFDAAQSAPFTLAPGGAHDVGTLTLATSRGGLAGTATLEGETDHSGILVTLQGTGFATLTGPAGAYTFSGIPVGQYTVVATKTGFAQASVADQTVLVGQATTVPALLLARNPGTVTGIVRYEDQSDHTGILVALANSPYSGSTDNTGRFTITGVEPGPYSASAQAAGYARYDYPLVVVNPGQTTDLGTSTLARLKGRIEGVVELQGMTSHGGVTVVLQGTSHLAYSGLDGRWSLEVPVGNYPLGVKASLTHWSDATYASTITVTDSGVASVPLLVLQPVSNTVNGKVLLLGQPSHAGVTVELDGVAGTDTEGLYFSLVTTDPAGTFTFDTVPIGQYNVTYSLLPEWPALRRFAEVLPGDPLELPTETLYQRFVRINDDAPATRFLAVTLTLHSSDCYEMRVGDQADLSAVPWGACAGTLPWNLPGPDGWAYVYAQFKDSQLDESEVVYDRIWLDSTATVTAVTEDTSGQPKKRGDTIRFTLDTGGEAGGVATIDVDGYLSGIPLYDDGTHGDVSIGDGVYSADHVVQGSTDVQNATVTGTFTDKYGNPASGTAPGTITLANPPLILNIRVIPNSATGEATISWQTDELAGGRLDWGLTDLYGNVEEEAAPTTSKSFTLTGLAQSTPYHFRITATDLKSNFAMTIDRVFYLRPNPPEKVVGMPGDGRFDVRWEAPPQENVVGYHVYRSIDSGPRVKLTATPYTHEALVYYDEAVPNGTPREYWVTAVDEYGNESEDAPPVSGTPDEPPPAGTNVSGVLTGTTVWTTKGGPYIVTGSVLIPAGSLLVVGPGTSVLFAATGSYARIDGQIAVIGSSALPALFSSANSPPATGDWAGIRLFSTNLGNYDWTVGHYRTGNIVSAATIEYSGQQGLYLSESTLLVQGAEIRNCDENGIAGAGIHASFSTLLVTGSRIHSNAPAPRPSPGDTVAGLAIFNSTARLLGTSIDNNRTTYYAIGRSAAAILSHVSTLDLIDCMITSNTTSRSSQSSAPFFIQNSDVKVVSTTIQENTTTAGSESGVGGIWASGDSVMALVASTLGPNHQDGSTDFTASEFDNQPIANAQGTGPFTITGCHFVGSPAAGPSSSLVRARSTSFRWCHFTGGNNGNCLLTWDPYTAWPYPSYVTVESCSVDPGVSQFDACGNATATHNYWGPATTTEMDLKGPGANISRLWDYWDDFALEEIYYDNWAHGAFPMARIDTPRWGRRFKQGQAISFTGHADDPEDGPIPSGSLSWSSSIDGALSTGAALDVSTLSVGHHEIWLTATDSDGQEGKIYVELDVVD